MVLGVENGLIYSESHYHGRWFLRSASNSLTVGTAKRDRDEIINAQLQTSPAWTIRSLSDSYRNLVNGRGGLSWFLCLSLRGSADCHQGYSLAGGFMDKADKQAFR